MADIPSPVPGAGKPLAYVHLGDLHITDARARHYRSFLALLGQLQVDGASWPDAAYLPGGVADIPGTQLGPSRNVRPLLSQCLGTR